MTNDELRVAWRIQERLVKAQRKIQREMPLPAFWDDPECCDRQDLRAVSEGYTQWCRVDEDYDLSKHYFKVWTDGWDDMSENGDLHYIECMECNKLWALPEHIDWN